MTIWIFYKRAFFFLFLFKFIFFRCYNHKTHYSSFSIDFLNNFDLLVNCKRRSRIESVLEYDYPSLHFEHTSV